MVNRCGRIIAAFGFVVVAATLLAGQGLVTGKTLAGGTWQFPRGSLSAVSAPLGIVSDIAIDSAGNVYFVDNSNAIIGKVSTSGALTVLAGAGAAVSYATPLAGNPSLAGIAVDGAGNVYFSEAATARVRKLTPAGVVSTIAGGGPLGVAGDNGPALKAYVDPGAIAVARNGNVYFSDTWTNTVRRVDASGTITSLAITSQNKLNAPFRLAIDSDDNLYAESQIPAAIYSFGTNTTYGTSVPGRLLGFQVTRINGQLTAMIAAPTGIYRHPLTTSAPPQVTLVAGAASAAGYLDDAVSALNALFNSSTPWVTIPNYPVLAGGGMVADASGNLYVADSSNGRIRYVDLARNKVTTFAGNGAYKEAGDGGPAIAAFLNGPNGLTVDASGTIYIADSGGNRVRRIDTSGKMSTVAGSGVAVDNGNGGPATSAGISAPGAVMRGPSGEIFVSNSSVIRKIDNNGVISTVATAAGGAMAFDSAGNLDATTSATVVKIALPSGVVTTVAGNGSQTASGDGGPAVKAGLIPYGICFDAGGNLLIADNASKTIRRVDSSEIITKIAGGGTGGDGSAAISAGIFPGWLSMDSLGNTYFTNGSAIKKITPGGIINTVVDVLTARLTGLAVGPRNELYATYSDKVVRYDAAAPVISSLTPSIVSPGGMDFSLSVKGSGFDVDSIVLLKGSARKTTYVSAHELAVTITAADIAAASAAGVAVFNPSVGGAASVTSTLTISATVFTSAGVVNGASFQAGSAPGAIVSIFGSNLATGTAAAQALPLPTTLSGARLTWNGTPLPLYYVSPQQINAQMPFDAAGTGTLAMQADIPLSVSLAVSPAAPGIFTADGQQGIITNADGTLTDASHPAPAGSIVQMFCTGLGAVTPAVKEGDAAPASPPAVTPLPTVRVGASNDAAVVVFSGLAPGFAGLYQVNFVVPSTTAVGTASVTLSMNGNPSNMVTMKVGNP